jgi:ribonuclease P protein component
LTSSNPLIDRKFMQPARFRPHERIADPSIFRRAFERKKSVSDGSLIVYGIENGLDFPRLGISASKRKIRKACDRNRVKRMLREAFRISKAELPPGIDLIIVPRGAALTFDQACQSLPSLARSVARRLGIQVVKASP